MSPVLDRWFDSVNASLADARRAVAQWCDDEGVADVTRQHVLLATSELASNAVEATPGGRFRIDLRRRRGGGVALSVTNRADRDKIPARSTWSGADPLAERGRGLWIVDSIAHDLDIEHVDGHVVVTAHFD